MLTLFTKIILPMFNVLENLCTDVIIGQDNLTNHESLELHFGGVKPRK